MSHLDRHDAGQLLDYALRLRLAGHAVKGTKAKKPFLRRAKTLEKRALLLLGSTARFEAVLPASIQPS